MRFVAAGLVLTATLGCGSTEKQGVVGDELTSRTLAVTAVEDFEIGGRRVVSVRVCRSEPGQAINAFAFRLDGREPDARASSLPVSRSGCVSGTVAFAAGEGAGEELTFSYDDTGSAQPGDREEHVDFSWRL